MSVMSVN